MAESVRRRWDRLSPYLDQALTLSEQERSVWLASLREQNPDIGRDLQKLLQEQRDLIDSDFLEEQAISVPEQGGRAGLTVGSYTLISPIGQGGMSTVWLAERNDGRFQRKVAVKFLSIALYGRGEERFRREGSILGRLVHPQIAQLLDAGVSPSGEPYLVLEYEQGSHIDRYCDDRKLDIKERCRLYLDVISAVAHAHAHLVVHRDIKPSNVLVTNEGQVKLLDFGIAKLLEDEGGDAALTREGGTALTPQYAAPEQLKCEPVTTATDVYALGVLLYKLLSGQHPAGSNTHSHSDLVKAIVDVEPTSLSKAIGTLPEEDIDTIAGSRSTATERLRRELRGDLETIVAKALKKAPQDRYPSVAAFGDDLRRYLEHKPVVARPDSISYRATKFVRRNRMGVTLSALAMFGIAFGATAIIVEGNNARRQRDFAFRELARAEQVNQLDYFLLTDVVPSNQAVTGDELVADEEHFVQREDYKDNAVNHVKLLIEIGTHYMGRDQYDKALRVLQQAYGLSRSLQNPSARAQASCAMAIPVDRLGQHARAESLVEEGLHELNNTPESALDRVFCFLSGSDVAQADGDALHSISRAQDADRALSQAPYRPDTLQLETLLTLASAYSLAGYPNQALPEYEAASAELSKLGLDETRTAVTMYNDWGLALVLGNKFPEAEKIYSKGIALSRGNRQIADISASLLTNYADCLLQRGRLNDAQYYAEQASLKAKQLTDEVVYTHSLMERARIYRTQRDFGKATAALNELEQLLKRSLPPGHYAFASIASERSLIASGQGDFATALRLASEAISLDEAAIKSGGQGAFRLWVFYQDRAELEIGVHQSEQAASDAAHALDLTKAMTKPGTLAAGIGECSLTLARALEAEGKHEEARLMARSAVENLQDTFGPDDSQTLAARRLAGFQDGVESPTTSRQK